MLLHRYLLSTMFSFFCYWCRWLIKKLSSWCGLYKNEDIYCKSLNTIQGIPLLSKEQNIIYLNQTAPISIEDEYSEEYLERLKTKLNAYRDILPQNIVENLDHYVKEKEQTSQLLGILNEFDVSANTVANACDESVHLHTKQEQLEQMLGAYYKVSSIAKPPVVSNPKRSIQRDDMLSQLPSPPTIIPQDLPEKNVAPMLSV